MSQRGARLCHEGHPHKFHFNSYSYPATPSTTPLLGQSTATLDLSFSPVHAVIPLLLAVLIRVVYTRASRTTPMSYNVKWGREKLQFPLPPPETKLSAIRQQIADHTHLPQSSFKLIHAGAVMKDDSAPISSYGLKNKSTIAVVGGPEQVSTAPERKTEKHVITQIESELDKVRTGLLPSVDKFLDTLSNQTITPVDGLDREHKRLGELLLQSLLRLDAIHAESEWEQARKDRKAGVREVQALLDRLDTGWKARR